MNQFRGFLTNISPLTQDTLVSSGVSDAVWGLLLQFVGHREAPPKCHTAHVHTGCAQQPLLLPAGTFIIQGVDVEGNGVYHCFYSYSNIAWSCRMRVWRRRVGWFPAPLLTSASHTSSTWSAAGSLTSTTGWKWVYLLFDNSLNFCHSCAGGFYWPRRIERRYQFRLDLTLTCLLLGLRNRGYLCRGHRHEQFRKSGRNQAVSFNGFSAT